MEEKIIEVREIYQGKVLNLRLDKVMLPNGREAGREVVEHPGAVAVVARDDAGEIILVKQYRHPVKDIIWEIPAGKLEKGEDPLLCAKRELAEETGLGAEKWQHLSVFYTTPGFSDEIMYLYLAENLSEVNSNPDDDEFIEVDWFTAGELQKMLAGNNIKDAKTIVGLLWVLSSEI